VYFKHNQNITKITAMQINSLLFFYYYSLFIGLVSPGLTINARIVVARENKTKEN
jgi:hypothetical protein